jgi:hypothetical protein
MNWEYRVRAIVLSNSEAAEAELNRICSDGWEVVSSELLRNPTAQFAVSRTTGKIVDASECFLICTLKRERSSGGRGAGKRRPTGTRNRKK